MKHLLTLWMLALCLCVSAKETCPKVIPALQEWKGGSGKLVLPAEGSIVVAPADEAALKSVATVLAQDLKDLLDWNYTIRTGKPGKNDIYLSLMKPDKQLGEEVCADCWTLCRYRSAGSSGSLLGNPEFVADSL